MPGQPVVDLLEELQQSVRELVDEQRSVEQLLHRYRQPTQPLAAVLGTTLKCEWTLTRKGVQDGQHISREPQVIA